GMPHVPAAAHAPSLAQKAKVKFSRHVLHMTELPDGISGAPLEARWPTLTIESRFWSNVAVAVEYAQGVLISVLMKQLYGAPSIVLIDQAVKSLVWVRVF
ncbi:hypothetical protein GW17_00041045, partial [Ensete ventricosum]